MPKLGMAMSEGEVGRWLCADGAQVTAGQPILEVMSKKITYKVAAPAAGIVRHLAEVKAKAPIGAVLGYVLAAGESLPAGAAVIAAAGAGGSPASTRADSEARAAGPVLATPAAKRLARDRGVDLSRVRGTGPGGRIQEQDVEAYASAGRPIEPSPSADGQTAWTTLPFAGMRAAIAERMAQSLRETAPVTLMTEVDAGELIVLQESAPRPSRISLTSVLAFLTTAALKRHPRLNATLVGERIHLLPQVHLGVAVALDDGLIVPVVRDAHRLGLAAMDGELARLAQAARENTLSVDDVTGGTFTITNLGMFGVDAFTPIINQPECAILGVGRVELKPAVRDGAVVVRPHTTLSLTFDHRLLDGAPAAQFLKTLSDYIAHPGLAFVAEDGGI